METLKSKCVRPDSHKKPRLLFAELLGEELSKAGLKPTDILRRIWCKKTMSCINEAIRKGGLLTSDSQEVAKWLNCSASRISNIKNKKY